MELEAHKLAELLRVMREHGCARLQMDGLVLELWPQAPVSVPREVIQGTGTDADGLPRNHPGLAGVRIPAALADRGPR